MRLAALAMLERGDRDEAFATDLSSLPAESARCVAGTPDLDSADLDLDGIGPVFEPDEVVAALADL
jgi:hypothetical protein